MRFLVYGDLQATDGDATCFHDPSKSLQHWRVRKFFNRIAKLTAEHKCDGIIDLGDTTDDRSTIPLHTLDVLGKGLKKLAKFQPNYKLIGNHEQYLRDTSIDNRCLFEHIFEVCPQNQQISIAGINHFMCSYPESYAQLNTWLQETILKCTAGPKVLFGHFQIKGTRTNSGVVLDGIPLELLSRNFDLVVLGHIHASQYLAENVCYLGSPFQQDWGEQEQKKFVGIYDTSTLKMELVEITGFPVYRTIGFTEFQTLKFDPTDENRYRVSLASHEEAELFFKHESFARVDPIYAYDDPHSEQALSADWSFDAVTQRYLNMVDPGKMGIEMPAEEMLAIAKIMAGI